MDINAVVNTVKEFYEEVNSFGYDISFQELAFSQGKKHHAVITNMLQKTENLKLSLSGIKKLDIAHLNELVLSIMTEILGEEEKPHLLEFQKLTIPLKNSLNIASDNSFDSVMYIEYSDTNPYGVIKNFHISHMNTSFGGVSISHEYVHGLLHARLKQDTNHFYGNYHYIEFPSIMMEKIVADKFDNITHDEISNLMSQIRIDANISNVKEAVATEELMRVTSGLDVYADFQKHLAYRYLICDIYASYLFNLYNDDPVHFLKLYRSLIKNEISVPEYFKIYGVSLNKREVKDAYLKQLELLI